MNLQRLSYNDFKSKVNTCSKCIKPSKTLSKKSYLIEKVVNYYLLNSDEHAREVCIRNDRGRLIYVLASRFEA